MRAFMTASRTGSGVVLRGTLQKNRHASNAKRNPCDKGLRRRVFCPLMRVVPPSLGPFGEPGLFCTPFDYGAERKM